MGFYDAKGYWRNDGDGFYDSRGNWVSPGGAFYDGKGYRRSPGEGFYDAKGNWVSPGGAFYDSKGNLQSGVAVGAATSGGTGLVIGGGLLLSIPALMLWSMTMLLVEWMTHHLYIIFVGFIAIDMILCRIITKMKKHHGVKAAFSFIGNYMCILSFVYITLVYAVPDVMRNGGDFSSFFNLTITLGMGIAGIAILQFFNYFHERAVLEFILGILFFIIVILLLKYGTKDVNTLEGLAEVYHVEASMVFRGLFGFAI